jgi:hypothetical protein
MKRILAIVPLMLVTVTVAKADPDPAILVQASQAVALAAMKAVTTCNQFNGEFSEGRCHGRGGSVWYQPPAVMMAMIDYQTILDRYNTNCPMEFGQYECLSALQRAYRGIGLM